MAPPPTNNSAFNDPEIIRFESGISASPRSTSSTVRRHPSAAATAKAKQHSNISYFQQSAAVDVLAAGLASFFVALPVTAIDRAIVQNVAGSVPLGKGLKEGFTRIVAHPIKNITHPSYLMVFGVYALTYMTANTFESIIHHVAVRQPAMEAASTKFSVENETITANVESHVKALHWSKFLGVTLANMTAAVSKDRAFARMYGTVAPSKLPLVSWGCWITRDLLTIGAAFSLPKPLAHYLSSDRGSGQGALMTTQYATFAAQLLPVMLVQFVSTPLHLAANDFYNYKNGEPRVVDKTTGRLMSGQKTYGERWDLIKKEGPKSFAARICRIAPAFGFGGLGNTYVRDTLRMKLGLVVEE